MSSRLFIVISVFLGTSLFLNLNAMANLGQTFSKQTSSLMNRDQKPSETRTISSESSMAQVSAGFKLLAQQAAPAAVVEEVPAPQIPASGSELTYLICKNKKLVRTLRVLKKKNGGCTATYTKEGVDQVVGNSWATERCSRIIGNIKDTLEKADWKCKDISETRVSSSEVL